MSKKKKLIPPELRAGWSAHGLEMIKLREKWPKAFPRDTTRIKPLVVHALGIIAQEMGWTTMYARGVLQPWKKRAAYCKAVLRETNRINLDGSKSTELISDDARRDAQAQLEVIQQRAIARRWSEARPGETATQPPVASDEAA